ncbi:hypothetical protein [Kribbella sp. HUAS MG21]|jgi:ABC-type transporter Mla subunit MlaD|uniref:Uncharacterized protein n=1 Tax=Kribbella sp. HUAS MG21 TaxID=3160966 RepID=A0AAU7TDB6_9ACTN
MSVVQQLKEQLHHMSTEANRAAGSLGGFQSNFARSSAQVQALIAGSATRTDREISELLDAAGKAVGDAVQALQIAASGCASYANQI